MEEKNKIEEVEVLEVAPPFIEETKKKKKSKKIKRWQKFLIVLGGLFVFGLGSGAFLLYGPIDYFRNMLITTAMTTMNHQYLATWFYSDKTIAEVLDQNKVIESGESTNPDLVDLVDPDYKPTIYASKYEEEILKRDEEQDLFKVIPIKGSGYNGYLVAVYDPSKIHLAVTSYLNNKGEYITDLAKKASARVAINASGFDDPNWMGSGGLPNGTVIQNGKVVSDYYDAPYGGGFIGFTYENKLVLGKMTKEEALASGMRDAVEFGPFLIVNGKPSFVKGNGGWGIAPRTAIGQRKDGIVLFLVINGRLATSIGTDMVELTEIMKRYGAYNAANLDGGASTTLVVDHKIINKPVAAGPNGLRGIPTAWVVTE